ncbi:hypothetical protein K474DRAFT_1655422 [Panus rudis PR-1116 ss-1]|nr:hypothetical protein K474DRAFT_1655422 [Panus rudis PR-1116 ss-1]
MSLRERLMDAPSELLEALSQDSAALADFYDRWALLAAEVEDAIHNLSATQDDIEAANIAASQVQIITESVVALDEQSSQLAAELEREMAKLSLSPNLSPSTTTAELPHLRPVSSHLPPYLPSAFAWLSCNLHNPYPSRVHRQTVARREGYSVEVVSDWFRTIRRLIGWDNVCQVHFAGSRDLMLDMARRVFIPDEPAVPLDVDMELREKFWDMLSRLHGLYSNEEGFTTFPDNAPSSTSPDPPNRRLRSRENHHSRSPTPSLVSSWSSDSESDDTPTGPTPCAATSAPLKRCREYDDDAFSPCKRPCVSNDEIFTTSPTEESTVLDPSDDWWSQNDAPNVLDVDAGSSPITSFPRPRKRRLSDTGICGMPRRQCNPLPRRRIRTSPSPQILTIDDETIRAWSATYFDASCPASYTEHVDFCESTPTPQEGSDEGPWSLDCLVNELLNQSAESTILTTSTSDTDEHPPFPEYRTATDVLDHCSTVALPSSYCLLTTDLSTMPNYTSNSDPLVDHTLLHFQDTTKPTCIPDETTPHFETLLSLEDLVRWDELTFTESQSVNPI